MKDTANCVVERASAAHSDAMGRLWAKLIALMVEIDPEQYQILEAEGLAAYLREQLEQERFIGFIASVQGSVVGFLFGLPVTRPPMFRTSQVAVIEDMYVEAAFRHLGIGAALVRAFGQWATEQGIHQIELSAHVSNRLAQSFWNREGYRVYADFRRRTVGAPRDECSRSA